MFDGTQVVRDVVKYRDAHHGVERLRAEDFLSFRVMNDGDVRIVPETVPKNRRAGGAHLRHLDLCPGRHQMVGEGSMPGADLEDPALAIPFDDLAHQVVHARDHSLADVVMPDMRRTFHIIMTISVGAFLKVPNCGPTQGFSHARTLFR